jgi:hypothetical protein
MYNHCVTKLFEVVSRIHLYFIWIVVTRCSLRRSLCACVYITVNFFQNRIICIEMHEPTHSSCTERLCYSWGLKAHFVHLHQSFAWLWEIITTDDSKSAVYFRLPSFVSGARRRLTNQPTIFGMVWKALRLYAEGMDTSIKLCWRISAKLSWFILGNLSVTLS